MNQPKKALKQILGPGAMRAYHSVRSAMTSFLYGRPTRGMTVIGVTGTNGKTTTVHLIASIFEHAGYKVAMLSTVRFRIAGHEWTNTTKMTVPNPATFNRFVIDAKKAGCTVLVMEATSIALDQSRMNVQFDTGVLTNITHDHLDYHGTFDYYVQAKRKLFARDLRLSVLNADDPNGRAFAELGADDHILYSTEAGQASMLHAKNIGMAKITTFDCVLPNSQEAISIRSSLTGVFNISNILAAVAVGLGHGLSHDNIRKGVETLDHVPGRMEFVDRGQDFRVVIDYAHTPDALEKLFASLKESSGGSLIAVFGSCGDRDQEKRPIMGAIAGREASYCFVTNEDPYTEDPQFIIDSVAEGIRTGSEVHEEGKTYWRVLDRREAIRRAFAIARPGDTVAITGKGAEEAMVWGSEHRPWSDRLVVEQELDTMQKVSP